MPDLAYLQSGLILTETGRFFTDLFDSIASGILFFGGPLEIVRAVLDILVTTFVIYFILRIMRDSRAWQLVKGIILILVFAQVCVLLGLTTVGFLLGNTLSVLTIAFVVIFQPELRRALERVGRRSFSFLAGSLLEESPQSGRSMHNMIESIVRACDRMSESRTGALIVIERDTHMGELAEQENSVILDSAVSSAMLMQIFYKGSPLHDGAVLIRNGRILAARCHIPLSDNFHIRREFGTRHRAAVGVSEMGDAIAVVVSEERGTISVSFEGRLYGMENSDSLRTLLHRLLGSKQPSVISNILRGGRDVVEDADPHAKGDHAGLDEELASAAEADRQAHAARKPSQQKGMRVRFPRGRKLLMTIASLVIATLLWFYVQVTVNPVETKVYTIPLTVRSSAGLEENGLAVVSAPDSVGITVMARRKSLTDLPAEAITAYVDMTGIDESGNHAMTVHVEIDKTGFYRTTGISPTTASVKVGAAP